MFSLIDAAITHIIFFSYPKSPSPRGFTKNAAGLLVTAKQPEEASSPAPPSRNGGGGSEATGGGNADSPASRSAPSSPDGDGDMADLPGMAQLPALTEEEKAELAARKAEATKERRRSSAVFQNRR